MSKTTRLKVARKYAASWLEDIALLALSSNLLLLYYAGAWSDRIKAIELVELVILWALIPFALWQFMKHTREAIHLLYGDL